MQCDPELHFSAQIPEALNAILRDLIDDCRRA
ncbi:hypothetical protein DFR52_101530 [Hoeflea marina]|uniref:Uncharacterized protein n=1 Tax=Hoeflea marina TaxID=274592 RepID=A0A317PQT0_9HYPH|nr:hypothetical protein DFR52_101530 [Hoeflea marina]